MIPSLPHIANQLPILPSPPDGTAQHPIVGHGDVTFVIGVIVRTSVKTTVPSVDMDARTFPPDKNVVAHPNAPEWSGNVATVSAVDALESWAKTRTAPSLQADASRFLAPPSDAKLNRNPGSQRSEPASTGIGSCPTLDTTAARSRSHRCRSVPAAVARMGPPPSPSPTKMHPYTWSGCPSSLSTSAVAPLSGSSLVADASTPGCATRHTPTDPSAEAVASIFNVGCQDTRTTSSL
mmetsp:Transcript_1233/g.5060  ORF Transcript_1233/g.5060 Transcript_1233/m.5060 type:complete len:236 (+) Transcript_1233:359-1066(+)